MSAVQRTTIGPRYRSTMIIMLSFLASMLIYMLAAYVLALSARPPALDDPQQVARLFRIIYGAAFVLALAVIIGRRALFNSSRLRRLVQESGLNRLVSELASKTIVLAAMSEMITLLGLILSLLTKSYEAMLRLGLVGVLLLLYNLPRRSAWERTVENFSRVLTRNDETTTVI